MKIKSISIQNFRCFKNMTVNFDSHMNVIIGNNGVGKTAILDALAVGIGSFFLGIENIPDRKIKLEDVRYITTSIGSTIDRQPQSPVTIECSAILKENIKWKRAFTNNSKTTYGNAKNIKEYASQLQNEIRSGNTNIYLPLIAYYGIGRLWNQNQSTKDDNKPFNRFQGYDNCLSAKSNEKSMLDWLKKMTFLELQEEKEIPELQAVLDAVKQCYVESGVNVSDVKVRFSVKSERLEISYKDKNGNIEIHPFHELSAGYRNMLSLVADIAYRMAMLNPQLLDEVTQKTEGIVLIDEIDLHLHPIWQKKILKTLRTIFPCIQFIVTTHAPSIISSAKREELLILNDEHCYFSDFEVYGKDVNSVLSEIMGTPERPDEIAQMFDEFRTLLDNEQYDEAKMKLDELKGILGENDNEVISSSISLDFQKDWSE